MHLKDETHRSTVMSYNPNSIIILRTQENLICQFPTREVEN